MMTFNVMRQVAAWSPDAKRSGEPNGDVYVEARADLEGLSSADLVELHNTYVQTHPDSGLRTVNRFADRAIAVNRVWGLVVREMAIGGGEEAVAKPKTTKKPRVRAARKKTAVMPGEKPIKDKEVRRASKVYPVKPGSMQEHALALISRKGGIAVDDFVAEMNRKKKAVYSRSNAWSALVFILHKNKGYGIRCKDGVLSVL